MMKKVLTIQLSTVQICDGSWIRHTSNGVSTAVNIRQMKVDESQNGTHLEVLGCLPQAAGSTPSERAQAWRRGQSRCVQHAHDPGLMERQLVLDGQLLRQECSALVRVVAFTAATIAVHLGAVSHGQGGGVAGNSPKLRFGSRVGGRGASNKTNTVNAGAI